MIGEGNRLGCQRKAEDDSQNKQSSILYYATTGAFEGVTLG